MFWLQISARFRNTMRARLVSTSVRNKKLERNLIALRWELQCLCVGCVPPPVAVSGRAPPAATATDNTMKRKFCRVCADSGSGAIIEGRAPPERPPRGGRQRGGNVFWRRRGG